MSLSVGFSTGNFGNLTIPELVRACNDAGVYGVELWDDYAPLAGDHQIEELKLRLDEAGVSVVSVHASCVLQSADKYGAHFAATCEKAKHLGAGYVVVHPYLFGGEELAEDGQMEQSSHTWKLWEELVNTAIRHDLKVAFENLPNCDKRLPGRVVQEVLRIVEGFDSANVGVCFDISHSFANGNDPLEEVEQIEPADLIGIHVSDGMVNTYEDKHLTPGDGDMDWLAFLKRLDERGFQGKMIIEIKHPQLDGGIIRQARAYLQRASLNGGEG